MKSSAKSPRQLALAQGRGTYVSAKNPCPRCKGRKRYTRNGACKKCADALRTAIVLRKKEHAVLLDVPVGAIRVRPAPAAVGIHVCPTCKRPWPVDEGE